MYKNPNRIEPYKELNQTEPESKNVQERKTNWTLPHKEPNLTWTQKQKMSKYPKQIEPYPTFTKLKPNTNLIFLRSTQNLNEQNPYHQRTRNAHRPKFCVLSHL